MTDYRDDPDWYKARVKPGLPNTCGSCVQYSTPGNWFADCGLKLPPWVKVENSRKVLHNNSCSFYVSVEEKDRV